jgi:hypothetical protein
MGKNGVPCLETLWTVTLGVVGGSGWCASGRLADTCNFRLDPATKCSLKDKPSLLAGTTLLAASNIFG